MSNYLVTGATGEQGSAVVTHLLALGAKVHAVVRDAQSSKAAALREKGVVLFQGDHNSPDPVFRDAAAGCRGIFLNLTFFNPQLAHAHAAAILTACRAGAGESLVTVVLSSTANVPAMNKEVAAVSAVEPFLGFYYPSKAIIEAAVRQAGFPHYTILRPAALIHDFLLPTSAKQYPELPREGVLATVLNDDISMPYLADEDVGKFAAAALLDPVRFSGHEFDLATENLTAREVHDIMADVSGLDVKYHKRTSAEMDAVRTTTATQAFQLARNMFPMKVDVEALEKTYGIKLTTLEESLTKQKERLLNSPPPKSVATLKRVRA